MGQRETHACVPEAPQHDTPDMPLVLCFVCLWIFGFGFSCLISLNSSTVEGERVITMCVDCLLLLIKHEM